MWVSRAFSLRQAAEREGTAADMGMTTIGGKNASVMTRGEQRELEIFAPGGLVWQLLAGDTVLVVKGGVGCQERCVVAAETSAATPVDMKPGELFLYACNGASVFLRGDGTITVEGDVSLKGDADVEGNVSIVGNLEVRGNVKLQGAVEISGSLTINGEPYRPCRCGM